MSLTNRNSSLITDKAAEFRLISVMYCFGLRNVLARRTLLSSLALSLPRCGVAKKNMHWIRPTSSRYRSSCCARRYAFLMTRPPIEWPIRRMGVCIPGARKTSMLAPRHPGVRPANVPCFPSSDVVMSSTLQEVLDQNRASQDSSLLFLPSHCCTQKSGF